MRPPSLRATGEPSAGRWPVRLALTLGLGLGSAWTTAAAASPAEGATLRPFPPSVALRGPDATQQLAVDRVSAGLAVDCTATAVYESSNSAVVAVGPGGAVVARGDGSAVVKVTAFGGSALVPVTVRDFASGLPINFANQVVPVFTRLGCNSGGCHGKSSGQNGFRLSLLGFEPALDYETLVKEGRGRRLFPAAPDRSLLLQKAVARVPHGGGRKMGPDSHEYRVVRRWIAAGMPYGSPSDPVVDSIAVTPERRTLTRGARQQLVVTAHYSDGSTEDVTDRAQYQSNDPEVAVVAETGAVAAGDLAGQAAVMARYQGQVAAFRVTVPMGAAAGAYPEFSSDNPIDGPALRQWQALGLAPSPPCDDNEFLRRASIDVTGTIPTAAEARAFALDTDPDKRVKLVDRLLDRPEYAAYFAVKWADLLRNKRDHKDEYQRGTFSFHDWVRENLQRNTPYDVFVRSIVAASGTPETSPPVQWYRQLKTADAFVDDTAQVFLGMRLQCAKCHHHPFEKWGQDDYYGFAAYFARVGRKASSASLRSGRSEEVIFASREGAVTHPKTGRAMAPKGLGTEASPIPPRVDPRQALVDWMVAPGNPYFARALVNRYWAHFFGRGIVEPIDDLRQTNPPTNPELLDALADDFVAHHYDLKRLVRTIATSKTYGLSSVPSASNAKDRQSFARHYPKRLGAEALLDAVARLAEVPTEFAGLPAGTRAIELPDESVPSPFLDAFGRPKRDTSCECERGTEAGLGQSLMLLNSAEVQGKIAAEGGVAARLARGPGGDEAKVEELFWAAFGRPPSSGETATALAHLAKRAGARKEAFEDLLWALVNAREFQFND